MRVFVNPSGQRENLGDSVLRRAYLNELRACGELHVLAGEHPSYVSGLGLRPEDRIYESKREWLIEALRHSRREKSVFAVNAGEVVTGRNYVATFAWQMALAQSVRQGDGATIAMGIANREHPALTRSLLRQFARSADLVTWRDAEAASAFGVGAVQPDWATVLGRSNVELAGDSAARHRVVITLRGDREQPDATWFAAVEQAVRDMGSPEVVAVVQVMRDTERARELAKRFGGTTLEWPQERSHADHEEVLRDLYRTSRAVISDRIHALIIGMTEGAAPIGFTPHSAQKVSKTFGVIAASTPAWSSKTTDMTPSDHAARIVETTEQHDVLLAEISGARSRLEAASARLRHVVVGTVHSTA
ncbi:MAG TPA: hypothetical protein VIP82_04420 [Microbacterium sp.]|uniref:hypothetical protein n=1 Tax=Microbacterium sp. TaxID=51671 RepID=UPI002F94E7D2